MAYSESRINYFYFFKPVFVLFQTHLQVLSTSQLPSPTLIPSTLLNSSIFFLLFVLPIDWTSIGTEVPVFHHPYQELTCCWNLTQLRTRWRVGSRRSSRMCSSHLRSSASSMSDNDISSAKSKSCKERH